MFKVWNDGSDGKCFVFGHQFGPVFVAICDDEEAAWDQWDEDFGTRVDWEADASTLADYGETPEEQSENVMGCGDMRVNDVGTAVWVDHYEWVREFDTIAAAFAFAFGVTT